MRILHVMNESLPNVIGYTIRAKYLLEAQAAAGNEVLVLTSPSQGDSAVDEVISGVSYYRTHYTPLEKSLSVKGGKQLVFGRSIARKLEELLSLFQIDIIHAHTPFTVALPALRVAKKHGIPFVYEKRNLWEESARARGKMSGRWPFYQISRMVDRYVSRSANAVCVITESLRQHTIVMGIPQDRVIVVKNGVDIGQFVPRDASPEFREKARGNGSLVIGFIGSFFRFEGLPLLVEAFAELVKRYEDIRLVLVGDGEDMPEVRRVAGEKGVLDKIWITGRVPHEQVREFYSVIDIFVYPRLHSTLTELISPLKPLEPMAMEKCVVGSTVGGIRDLIQHGETGILFDAGSRDDLVQNLAFLVNSESERQGLAKRAREHVIRNHQWHIIARQYDEAYRIAVKR